MNQPLRVERLLRGRSDERVHYDVVDELCAHRAEKAEKIDLYRRRARTQDSRPSEPRVSGEINQQVDRVGVDLSRGLLVSGGAQVNEAVECGFEPPSQRTAIVRSIRVPQDLE